MRVCTTDDSRFPGKWATFRPQATCSASDRNNRHVIFSVPYEAIAEIVGDSSREEIFGLGIDVSNCLRRSHRLLSTVNVPLSFCLFILFLAKIGARRRPGAALRHSASAALCVLVSQAAAGGAADLPQCLQNDAAEQACRASRPLRAAGHFAKVGRKWNCSAEIESEERSNGSCC